VGGWEKIVESVPATCPCWGFVPTPAEASIDLIKTFVRWLISSSSSGSSTAGYLNSQHYFQVVSHDVSHPSGISETDTAEARDSGISHTRVRSSMSLVFGRTVGKNR